MKKFILETTADELANAASTNLVAESQKKATGTTLGLGTAFKGLGIKIKSATASLITFLTTNPVGWVMTAVVAVGLLAKGYLTLAESAERCKERADELLSSFKSALDTANNNAKTVEELASKYEELSKGVNNLGENVSLTADEYTEYNKVVNHIAEMFPTLVKGYTDEGNAILSLKGNVEDLRDAYKEAQMEAYNLLIVSGKDSDGNDILKDANNVINHAKMGGLFGKGATLGGNKQTIEYIDEISRILSQDNYKDIILSKTGLGTSFDPADDDKVFRAWFTYLTGISTDGWKYISDITDEQVTEIIKQLKISKQALNAEINSAVDNVETIANAYLMTNEDYAKLDEQSKNAASIIVNSLNADIVSSFGENKENVGKYVDNIVQTISTNPEIQDALVGLFSLNISDLPVNEAKSLIDTYIEYIAKEISENPLELEVRLGFNDTIDTAKRLQNSIHQITDDHGISDRKEYATLSEYTKEFTQEQAELWLQATLGAQDATEAVQMYENEMASAKNSNETPISLSTALTSSEESLDKFQSSVKSAADAYTTLLTGNYSSSELLDSIQAITKAASDMGESIDWESISASGNPLQAIQNAIESVSKSYADSVLSGAGIDTDSKFGQILANIVQETYKSEAALDGLNTQIDSLQSAYDDLTDIVATYNETGYITFDQLQTLLAMEPQYLSCLIDENGQLQLNQESMMALANQRLDDAEAQVIQQAITELGELAYRKEQAAIEDVDAALVDNAETLTTYEGKLLETAQIANLTTSEFVKLSNAINGAMNEGASQEQTDAVIDNMNKKLQLIGVTRSNLSKSFGGIVGGKTSSSSSSKSEFSETVDFFERRVEVLDNALSRLDSTMDNIAGSFGKNNLIGAELGITEEKFNNYTDAISMYTQKANEAFSKLPSDIASKVKDGAVALTDFIGDGNKDVVEAIKEYESWADKIADCQQELAELQKAIRQLELDKFNNIMDDFQDQFNLRGDSKDLISKQIDLLKEAGELIGESFFTAQIDQSKKQLELLENEKAQLVNQMSSAISSGRIQSGTDEWLEMTNALSDVDGSILDCKKSLEEFDNSILELHTEIFNRIQDQFSNLDSEISNIIDLFDDYEISDDKGIWSKEAIAQLGLLTQQYELAQYQVQQYNDEIDELNAQYLSGKYSATEYADKLAELNSAQWDAVKSTESAKDAIMDLNETRIENQIKGIEKEIDAYKELTDAQIEALREKQKLHDYEKSISDETKTINSLQAQIAAMVNDNSAATVAKRKQLEQQLADAKADLEEAEYEHSMETQENALNKQYENYEKTRNDEITALRESLNDRETILAESFNTVKNNASTVGQEIATIATQHGVTVSKSLISSWQSGEKAIASYGEVLSQNTSTFIGNIMNVENEVWNLQAQADTTADSLAWMFSTRADNLVNELNTSYYAEANLANMTNALQQSLINTLERGYDVSSIVNSLNAITDAANKARAATSSIGNLPTTNVPQSTIQHGVTDGINTLFSSSNIEDINKWLNENKSIYSLGNVTTSDSGSKTFKVKKYASGSSNIEEDQLAITNEAGQELIYHAADGSILTPLRQGDKVFNNESVNRLWQLGHGIVPPDMTKNLSMPTVLPNNVNNNSVNVHYDSMFKIEGDVIDADRITKRMEGAARKIANQEVYNGFRKLSEGIRY